MNKPEVKRGFNSYSYLWEDLAVCVVVDRLTDDGVGELSFWHGNGDGRRLLHFARANLLSTQTCSQLAKRLRLNLDVDWDTILTYVCTLSLQECRKGEPAVEIWPREGDTLKAEYLLEPILYLNQPTVMFGDYGSCKSLISLALAYIVQLPLKDNLLGLTTWENANPSLFLDYEDDQENFNKRWSALRRGFQEQVQAAMPILYRRMVSPLYDNVEQVQRLIYDNKIKFIIVDSLGPAARGNLNDAEPAIRYYEALRSLRTTSLTLAHCAKDALSRNRTIFGSVFFTNLARAVWECKAEGEDPTIVSLKRTKANLSRREATLGFSITVNEDTSTITIEKGDLKDTSLSGELPLALQIEHLLLREGPKTARQIAEALGKSENTIQVTLNRMEKKSKVVKLGGHLWAIKAEGI